ncbi:hypothetical protein scyTo_0026839, partial [Scyliorhinus torazame]|nr:hypothetical protein [Scyliorhinus torazame]
VGQEQSFSLCDGRRWCWGTGGLGGNRTRKKSTKLVEKRDEQEKKKGDKPPALYKSPVVSVSSARVADKMSTTEVPEYSPFFAVMGASAAMVFSALGAAYGTAKSGTGIAAMSVMRPEQIMKSIIPVVMAGIIAIYGLVVAVLIANSFTEKITLFKGFLQLGAGLSVGLSGLAAGFAIGIVGDAGVR